MPLSRREIRTRAVKFAKQWAGATEEEADAKPFWYEFFNIFGIRARTVGSYEVHVRKLDKALGKIDYFWPGMVLIEHKSRGKDLKKAAVQAVDYLHGVKEHEKPRYIIVSDFARFVLYDLESGVETELLLEDLPQRIELFDFIAGYEVRPLREQDPVNIRAAEYMGELHDELKASGYGGKELEVYLVRLLFILFADDTGIFEQDAFYNFIVDQTREDGTDTGPQLARIFQLLNTPEEKRQKNLDERLKDFKYINGKLFADPLPIADWNGGMRVTLLECAGLNWSRISPAIFGALFQSAMDAKARRNLGAHYTSEQNILKLIKPLFLDELWDEFEKVKGSKPKLDQFHKKLSELRFLDPACGCGNFLVITYRELRELEIAVITAQLKGQQVVDVDKLVLLNVDRFYGIEIEEFPAQIAQVAMWLMDHQMNQRISAAFGEYMVRIPLTRSATIACANALRCDWRDLLLEGEHYDFILGNPPFIGHQWRTIGQQADHEHIWGKKGRVGRLDFVTCWFKVASGLVIGTTTQVAFVSTNSIVQGEQPAIMWSVLNRIGIEKTFAYRTFKWNNEARGIAQVHVVIIGFGSPSNKKKLIYDEELMTDSVGPHQALQINGYLLDAADVILESRGKPIWFKHPINKGSQPTDGGGLILDDSEYLELKEKEPAAEKWIRPYMGAFEFINGNYRHCLWLKGIGPTELKNFPIVRSHLDTVVQFRKGSPTASVRSAASTPTLFTQDRQPETPFLVIPEVSSENRAYIPIGFIDPIVVPANTVQVVANADMLSFGFIQSLMHMAWTSVVCGRMKSDFRYTPSVYNNFPWPEQATTAQQATVESAAQGVLDARAQFPTASLADLYDPLTMPPALVKAHQTLDKAVDQCYRPQAFANDAKRVEFLFEFYEKYTAGLLAGMIAKKKRSR
ncbi:MAG: class I SAM-dependent DNA methyltransferase [Flavobacteriales bacterium]|nr:class I SAM-dependent DNA methyltransferase [Flavobacteriales bacterium]